MQSKGGYDEVTDVPEDVTPSGQYVVCTIPSLSPSYFIFTLSLSRVIKNDFSASLIYITLLCNLLT